MAPRLLLGRSVLIDSHDSTVPFPPGFSGAAAAADSSDERDACVLVPRVLLLQIISSAARGDRLDPRLQAALVACAAPVTRRPRRGATLTRRELEVLERLAGGLSYKQIGADLHISIDTVRTYVRTLYRKLGAHSVTEAIASARQLGLVELRQPLAAAALTPSAPRPPSDDDIRLF